jgi:hypothetical protein
MHLAHRSLLVIALCCLDRYWCSSRLVMCKLCYTRQVPLANRCRVEGRVLSVSGGRESGWPAQRKGAAGAGGKAHTHLAKCGQSRRDQEQQGVGQAEREQTDNRLSKQGTHSSCCFVCFGL